MTMEQAADASRRSNKPVKWESLDLVGHC